MFKVGHKYRLISNQYVGHTVWTTGKVYTAIKVDSQGFMPVFIDDLGDKSGWHLVSDKHSREYFEEVVPRIRNLPDWF